jgi:hypothetical protein
MIAVPACTPLALLGEPDSVYSRTEWMLDLVERSISVLERLGGVTESECQALRQLVTPAIEPPAPLVSAPLASAPLVPVAERIELSTLLESVGSAELAEIPEPAELEPPEAAAPGSRSSDALLPGYPRVGSTWKYLFSAEPSHSQRIRCGYYLSKCHWEEFGRHARTRTTTQDGTTSKQKLYKRDWMLARMREFAAKEGVTGHV